MRLLPIATTLCALAVPATASAAFPGANGPIAFDRGGSILSVDATLSASGYDFAPDYSPDGSQVVYAVNRDIFVMNADGSGRRQLTSNGGYNSDPAWSPDGKRIVYSGAAANGERELLLVSAKGGTSTQLTATDDHDETEPAFSPDGGRIAYTRSGCDIPNGGGTCVFVMPAAGGGGTNLTAEDSIDGCESQPGYFFDGSSNSPTWSPDGKRIAFSGPVLCSVSKIGSDIWVMSADGSGKTDLTHDDGTSDIEPAFSPDGAKIAFSRNYLSGPTSVFTLSGSTATQISTGGMDRNPNWGVAPKHCVVPKLKTAKLADAKARLPLMGCRLGTVLRKTTRAARGTIVAQSAKAGAVLKINAKVDLTIDR